MKQTLQTLDRLLDPLRMIADKVGAPILDLTIRIYVALIFFKSGQLKFGTWLNDDFGSTIFLFEEIHPVPGIDPTLAAYAATSAEVILPILLVVGLFTRFAAAGLLIMTMTIQYLIGGDFYIKTHEYWMLLLAVPFIRGPGVISLDALLRYVIWSAKKEPHDTDKERDPAQS